MTGIPSDPPERHRAIAGRFTEAVRATSDWDAPTPVPEWTARDVVGHLVEWFPPFLASGSGIQLPEGPAVADDPVGAWQAHADAVQALLDDPGTPGREFANPHTGTCRSTRRSTASTRPTSSCTPWTSPGPPGRTTCSTRP